MKTEHLWSVVAVFGEEFAAGAGAVGLPGQGQDFGVVDEAVDHGGGDDLVAEDLTPANGRFEVTMIEPCS